MTTNATVSVSVTELDIALEQAMKAIGASDSALIDLALRSRQFDALVAHFSERLGVPVTGSLQDVVAATLWTGIVAERVLAANRENAVDLTAVEFGYRACEKGHNLQAALSSATHLTRGSR